VENLVQEVDDMVVTASVDLISQQLISDAGLLKKTREDTIAAQSRKEV
jgi:hypothetical protein